MLNVKWNLDRGSHLALLGLVSWHLGGIIGIFCSGWIAFITLWFGASLIYLAVASQKVSIGGKAVLVTGCDSGFGYALALHLDKLGFYVYAACLFANKKGDGAEALRKLGSNKLRVIQMNVTSENEIHEAREQVDKFLEDDKLCLWGIINNAGMGTFGDLEWVPISTFKRIADVNVFGIISVTKAFLPLIRRSKGRIVNVASMLGRMGVPMRSPYVLTKYAVEGVSDCLRHEMKPWGVDVIIIEPGNYIAGTNLFTEDSVAKQGDEMWQCLSEEAKQDYGEEFFKSRVEIMKSYVTGGDRDITEVISAFEDSLTQKYPQERYQPMDLYYKTRVFVATHFPEWIYDQIYVGCIKR